MGYMPHIHLLCNLGAFESVALAVSMLTVLIALLASISPGNSLFSN